MGTLERFATAMQIVFYLSPLIIALVTFLLAWWRFRVFRISEPVVKIDLRVTSRRCSPSYNALNAVAALTNTSRVAVQVIRLEWRVFVLSPYSDEEVESKINEYEPYMAVDGSPVEFPWNVNYTLSQANPMIFLEPGETNTIGMSLAIPNWIEAIDVLIELDSPLGREGPALCWAAQCPHDIKMEVPNGD